MVMVANVFSSPLGHLIQLKSVTLNMHSYMLCVHKNLKLLVAEGPATPKTPVASYIQN